MATLPDSSVWIEFFRHGEAGRAVALGNLLARRDAVTCGQVATELASGVGSSERMDLWRRLTGLRWVGLDRDDWLRVAEVKRALDETGDRVPLTDIEIAMSAARSSVELWTFDKDFERVAEAMPELQLAR